MAKRKHTSKGYEKLAEILSNTALLALANVVIHVFNINGNSKFDLSNTVDVFLTLSAFLIGIWFFKMSVNASDISERLMKKE